MKDLLKSTRSQNSQTLHSAHRLIIEFIMNISCFEEYCLELSQGVSLIQTIENLHALTTPSIQVFYPKSINSILLKLYLQIQKKIISVAEKLLSKCWYNRKGSLEYGKNSNINIGILVKAYLSSANIKTISGLVGTLQNQAEKLQTKDDCLLMLSSINKQNFHVFYNGLCTALLQR